MDPDLQVHSSDDEETLAMKENLLKIRLKKKLLAKSNASSSLSTSLSPKKISRPSTPPPKPLSSLQNPFASPKSASSFLTSHIQVPGSPSPRNRAAPISPARITLGIDKGRTGRDVSLRRTPEKPAKSFNQRLTDSKDLSHKQETKAKQLATARTSSFNPVPAFSTDSKNSEIESVTNLSITRRKVSAEDCKKAAQSVTRILSLQQFYAEVSPPDYEMAETILEYIVYGIVSSKTTARTTNSGAKYCVMQLTDFKTDITLFLYDSAFEEYWTLPLGTLCYLLNPQFQKPRGSISKSSLKMTDANGILEIGKSSDFGICRSVKKDGTQCTAWINAKKQEVCDFHIDLTLQKSLNKRIEFASGTKLFDPRQPSKKKRKEADEYAQHAVFFGDQVTTLRNPANSDDYEAPVKDTARLQRESEARQREREVLAKLLKNSTASAGHEYFETTDPNAPPPGTTNDDEGDGERERVFSATVLRKLGFDPTKRINTSSVYTNTTNGSGTEEQQSTRELEMMKDKGSVDLTVELGKGSAFFQKPGLPKTTAPTSGAEAVVKDIKNERAGNESDSDLEIIR